MKQYRKMVATMCVLCFVFPNSYGQVKTVDDSLRAQATDVWTWINTIFTLAILATTVTGIIVTYSKKNSDQPGEFKKYVIGFVSGIVFLVVALGILNGLRTMMGTSMNVSFK